MADSGYALTSATPVNVSGAGTFNIAAGTLLTNAATIAAFQAAGGQLGSANDPMIVAAAAIAQKLKLRGADEAILTRVMLAAAAASADAETLSASQFAVDGTGAAMLPSPTPSAGVVQGATFMCDTTPAAGESAVIQLKNNGTNVGTALTYDSTKTGLTLYTFVIPAGTLSAVGDVWTVADTYTAGGGPALTGKKATVTMKIAP